MLFRYFSRVCAHSVRFPTSSLTIRKNANVVAVQKWLHQVLYLFINILLRRFLVKHAVKVEKMFDLLLRCHYFQLQLLWVLNLELSFNRTKRIPFIFVSFVISRENRPHSHEDPYVSFQLQVLVKQLFFEVWIEVIPSMLDCSFLLLQKKYPVLLFRIRLLL